MRWRSRLGVTLATLGALGACGRSHQAVNGGASGDGATAGSTPSAGNASAWGGSAGSSTSAGTTSSAGTGANAGTTGGAGAPDRDDHHPLAVVPACLQPKPRPEGREPPTEVKVGATWLRSSERDCTWTVGEPLVLPLEPGDGSELLFQFDLNGDHVDDLIFGDHAIGTSPASGTSLVLLESRLDDGELTYERSSCDSPWDTSYRSFYARDLDRDGQLDFVIGRINGVSAMLNRGDERPEVLHYDWLPGASAEAWTSILDVAVGDFDADGRDDIAIGYDRTDGARPTLIELGLLLFRERSAQGTYGPPEALSGTVLDLASSSALLTGIPAGLLAAVPTTGGASTLFTFYMTPGQGTGIRYENGDWTSFSAASVLFAQPIFARGAAFGGAQSLMIGGRDAVEIIQASFPYEHVASVPMAYRHAGDHELGGGTRVRSVFLLDLDGDGDEDLVESGSESGGEPGALWVHQRTSEGAFAEPTLVQEQQQSSRFLESPFVRAGVMPGRLFVGDGSPGTAAVWPIVCGDN